MHDQTTLTSAPTASPLVDPQRAGAVLARAFHDDDFMRWAEPDDPRRARMLATIFPGLLISARRQGWCLEEPGVGAAEWKPWDHLDLSVLDTLRAGLWKVAFMARPSALRRLASHDSKAMDVVRPRLTSGSVYLSTIGIDPSQAGQGHGSRLLHHVLTRMARQWDRCVLRTEQPKNVPFYLRHGFALVDEQVIALSGLKVWVFERPLTAP
jgi:GNAT superfamily N-acetyltransferase